MSDWVARLSGLMDMFDIGKFRFVKYNDCWRCFGRATGHQAPLDVNLVMDGMMEAVQALKLASATFDELDEMDWSQDSEWQESSYVGARDAVRKALGSCPIMALSHPQDKGREEL